MNGQGLMEYNIGFSPEMSQSSWGIPQTAPFGNAIRQGFSPLYGANFEWFVFEPYAWPLDFYGRQKVGIAPTEYLHADFWGYRGIMPYSLQSASPEPYPYQLGYPYNRSA